MTRQQQATPDEARLPLWLTELRAQWSAEFIETNISWLLLTEDTVYKFKRPVRFEFLDYSTQARRRYFCEEELRLNSRFAPALYREVGTFGPTDEPAVVMNRFVEADRLDHVCRRGDLRPAHIADLVSTVVALHEHAPSAAPDGPLGSPATIGRRVATTLATAAESGAADDPRLPPIAAWLTREHDRLAPLLQRRLESGLIREGHGDLHLANLLLLDGVVTPFDGIEFSDELRWLDVANELAFPYIGLLDHGQPALASTLIDEWLTLRGDAEAVSLVRYYGCYRALVRAMVSGFEHRASDAERYLAIAADLAAPVRRRLVITHGLSGSGKSTAARQLILADPRAATVMLRSDVERKRLHGLNPHEDSRSPHHQGIYSESATADTYWRLAQMSEVLLASGWSVVADATFLEPGQRDLMRAVAQRAGADFRILHCQAPLSELQRRIRTRGPDASEADLTVLAGQLAGYAPLSADELAEVFITSTSGTG